MEYEKQVKKSMKKGRAKKKPTDKKILNRLMHSYITLLTEGFRDCLLIFLTAVVLLFTLFHSYHLY